MFTDSPPPFVRSMESVHNPRRDESPPASPQFISRLSKPKILARQYAPIAPVAFTRRSTFTPLTPSTIDYNVSTCSARNSLHHHHHHLYFCYYYYYTYNNILMTNDLHCSERIYSTHKIYFLRQISVTIAIFPGRTHLPLGYL